MAFTVEDGTGLVDSNSYLEVDDFRDHHEDRGIDTTEYTGGDVEAALVQATDYIDKRFGARFRGYRASASQQLEWPRADARDDSDYRLAGIPRLLKLATAEYALIVLLLGRNLAPIPSVEFGTYDEETQTFLEGNSGLIVAKGEEVGPIKEDTRYASGNQTGRILAGTGNLIQRIPEYPQADLWIEKLLVSYTNRSLSRG